MFDLASMDTLQSELEDWASDLCETAVDIDMMNVKKFMLKLNKKSTKAKVILKVKATGSSAEGDGKGIYQFIAKGPWTPAP